MRPLHQMQLHLLKFIAINWLYLSAVTFASFAHYGQRQLVALTPEETPDKESQAIIEQFVTDDFDSKVAEIRFAIFTNRDDLVEAKIRYSAAENIRVVEWSEHSKDTLLSISDQLKAPKSNSSTIILCTEDHFFKNIAPVADAIANNLKVAQWPKNLFSLTKRIYIFENNHKVHQQVINLIQESFIDQNPGILLFAHSNVHEGLLNLNARNGLFKKALFSVPLSRSKAKRAIENLNLLSQGQIDESDSSNQQRSTQIDHAKVRIETFNSHQKRLVDELNSFVKNTKKAPSDNQRNAQERRLFRDLEHLSSRNPDGSWVSHLEEKTKIALISQKSLNPVFRFNLFVGYYKKTPNNSGPIKGEQLLSKWLKDNFDSENESSWPKGLTAEAKVIAQSYVSGNDKVQRLNEYVAKFKRLPRSETANPYPYENAMYQWIKNHLKSKNKKSWPKNLSSKVISLLTESHEEKLIRKLNNFVAENDRLPQSKPKNAAKGEQTMYAFMLQLISSHDQETLPNKLSKKTTSLLAARMANPPKAGKPLKTYDLTNTDGLTVERFEGFVKQFGRLPKNIAHTFEQQIYFWMYRNFASIDSSLSLDVLSEQSKALIEGGPLLRHLQKLEEFINKHKRLPQADGKSHEDNELELTNWMQIRRDFVVRSLPRIKDLGFDAQECSSLILKAQKTL